MTEFCCHLAGPLVLIIRYSFIYTDQHIPQLVLLIAQWSSLLRVDNYDFLSIISMKNTVVWTKPKQITESKKLCPKNRNPQGLNIIKFEPVGYGNLETNQQDNWVNCNN